MATVSVNRTQQFKRRSNRMALNAKVGVSGEDRQRYSFTMPAYSGRIASGVESCLPKGGLETT